MIASMSPVELALADNAHAHHVLAAARRWAAVRRAARPLTDYLTPHVGPYATSADLAEAEQALLAAIEGKP